MENEFIENSIENTLVIVENNQKTKKRGRPKKQKEIKNNISFEVDETNNFDVEHSQMEDDFLSDLNRTNYEIQRDLDQAREEVEIKPSKMVQIPQLKRQKPVEDEIFSSENPTEILGKDKRVLLTKVKQYKQLFPDELKGFKIKANASAYDLKVAIEEMDGIISTNGVDQFLTDSIIGSLKMIEGITAHTKNYNISGLAELLKGNPKFHSLTKQLYLKYNCFDAVPPEHQLVFLVATTAYICRNKNANRDQLEAYLNQPVQA